MDHMTTGLPAHSPAVSWSRCPITDLPLLSVKPDCPRPCATAKDPLVNRTHLLTDSWPGKFCSYESPSARTHRFPFVITHFNQLFYACGNFLRGRADL